MALVCCLNGTFLLPNLFELNFIEIERYLDGWDKLFSKCQAFIVFILLAIRVIRPLKITTRRNWETVLFY